MPGLPFDPKTAVFYGRFVNTAYTMYGADSAKLTPLPSADFPADYELIAWIQMCDFILWNTAPVFYGFIANRKTDPTKLIMAIRGTDNPVEIWDDLNAIGMTSFLVGNVALGFGRIYETLQVTPVGSPSAMQSLAAGGISFAEQVARLSRQHAAAKLGARATEQSVSVEVAGHSLGSALATYYVMENAMTHKIKNPAICTFASPKVGDSTFTDAFDKLELTSWRVANVRDVVPKLPLGFFRHVNSEALVDSTGKVGPGIICCHKLTTYLGLLDPSLPIDADCQIPAHLAPGETVEVAVQQGVRSSQAKVWPDV
jgi:hypothetical protein